MATTLTMAELAEAKDVDLGTSEWLEVTQDMVNQFADCTLDHQWIHVDLEKANAGPFGGPIAHGFLTLSFLPHLVGDMVTVSDSTAGINYGCDKLRFTSPVRVGARVRAAATLSSTEPKAGGTLMRTDVTVEIEGEERPALVAQWLTLRFG